MSFDPEKTLNPDSGIFGLPYSKDESKLVIMPVPWDVTASYGKGAYKGPQAILKASPQLDLFDADFKNIYNQGIHLLPISDSILKNNEKYNMLSHLIVQELETQDQLTESSKETLQKINDASKELEEEIYKLAKIYIDQGKIFSILGGDHSAPLGAIKAYLEVYQNNLSILHIDAHADLRKSYQGFDQSHASIMYNVIQKNPRSLTQVGIRDFCEFEYNLMQESDFISAYLDKSLKENEFNNIPWQKTCESIIKSIKSKYVYISFDIDGLSPEFCPNTGTPVPGGISYSQAIHLVKSVVKSGKIIVGFDLCEVSPDPHDKSEWDGNVGARVLYQLSGWSLKSQESL